MGHTQRVEATVTVDDMKEPPKLHLVLSIMRCRRQKRPLFPHPQQRHQVEHAVLERMDPVLIAVTHQMTKRVSYIEVCVETWSFDEKGYAKEDWDVIEHGWHKQIW